MSSATTRLSRRGAVGAFAAAAAGLAGGMVGSPARAAGPSTPTHYRFRLGEFEVTTIRDGAIAVDRPYPIFGENVDPAEVAAFDVRRPKPGDRHDVDPRLAPGADPRGRRGAARRAGHRDPAGGVDPAAGGGRQERRHHRRMVGRLAPLLRVGIEDRPQVQRLPHQIAAQMRPRPRRHEVVNGGRQQPGPIHVPSAKGLGHAAPRITPQPPRPTPDFSDRLLARDGDVASAFRMMTAIQAEGVEWGADDRQGARDAVAELLRGRMDRLSDEHLERMAELGEADRRNGGDTRWLLTELGMVEPHVPRTRTVSALEVVRAYASRAKDVDRMILACFLLGLSTRSGCRPARWRSRSCRVSAGRSVRPR